MTASWPYAVPQKAVRGTYSSAPRRNVESFQPDAGPSIDRRMASVAMRALSFVTEMTASQLQVFEEFYRDTLADGTLPFGRLEPRTGAWITCKFIDTYSVGDVTDDIVRVALKLMVLP